MPAGTSAREGNRAAEPAEIRRANPAPRDAVLWLEDLDRETVEDDSRDDVRFVRECLSRFGAQSVQSVLDTAIPPFQGRAGAPWRPKRRDDQTSLARESLSTPEPLSSSCDSDRSSIAPVASCASVVPARPLASWRAGAAAAAAIVGCCCLAVALGAWSTQAQDARLVTGRARSMAVAAALPVPPFAAAGAAVQDAVERAALGRPSMPECLIVEVRFGPNANVTGVHVLGPGGPDGADASSCRRASPQ